MFSIDVGRAAPSAALSALLFLAHLAAFSAGAEDFSLAPIAHQASTATAQWHALSGFHSVGLLNLVSTTLAPLRFAFLAAPKVQSHHPGGPFAARRSSPSVAKARDAAPLNRLATNPGEKCGLAFLQDRVMIGRDGASCLDQAAARAWLVLGA